MCVIYVRYRQSHFWCTGFSSSCLCVLQVNALLLLVRRGIEDVVIGVALLAQDGHIGWAFCVQSSWDLRAMPTPDMWYLVKLFICFRIGPLQEQYPLFYLVWRILITQYGNDVVITSKWTFHTSTRPVQCSPLTTSGFPNANGTATAPRPCHPRPWRDRWKNGPHPPRTRREVGVGRSPPGILSFILPYLVPLSYCVLTTIICWGFWLLLEDCLSLFLPEQMDISFLEPWIPLLCGWVSWCLRSRVYFVGRLV